MSAFVQIMAGSGMLLICLMVHIGCVTWQIRTFHRWRNAKAHWFMRGNIRMIIFLLLGILASHTVQVYLWAFAFLASGAITDGLATAIYYALTSYTTLGYGDVTLTDEYRIFGAMSSVVGLLSFGMSTAFLVGFFERMLKGRES